MARPKLKPVPLQRSRNRGLLLDEGRHQSNQGLRPVPRDHQVIIFIPDCSVLSL
ncbi:hypothetical protein ABH945_007173 [Paraburkholderia sp. GAS333]